MSPSTAELARALVASPRWGWRAGMRAVDGRTGAEPLRLTRRADDGSGYGFTDAPDAAPCVGDYWTEAGDVPDLDDPATVGVLLEMLTQLGRVWTDHAHGSVTVEVWVIGLDPEIVATGPTLGEAVARALLAVWGEPWPPQRSE